MHDYIAARINPSPCNETITDLLAALLADIDFESFVPDDSGLTAYIRKDKYNAKAVEEVIKSFPMDCDINLITEEIPGEDWNKEWEQNYFKPILIDDKLVVRSSFHDDFPPARLEIVINPKMAFGTGHHATTASMARLLLNENLNSLSVIDMGTGTGILSILAMKLGASSVTGIDIDEFAIENAIENSRLNNVKATWITGDDKVLNTVAPADIFLANINLNVIIQNLAKYVKALKPGGKIFLSGFLTSDYDTVMAEAVNHNLIPIKGIENDNWLAVAFKKLSTEF